MKGVGDEMPCYDWVKRQKNLGLIFARGGEITPRKAPRRTRIV